VGVVDVRRALLAALALLCGCAPSQETPADVASAYFEALGSDPLRTLPLLTDTFHRRHGLRVATAADAQRGAAVDAATPLALDRHQLGWLAIQSRPSLAQRVSELATQIGDTREDGARATVAVRVDPRDGPGFEQRFELVRGDDGAWRIDAIEQLGVAPASAVAAFAAYPSEAGRRALAAGQR